MKPIALIRAPCNLGLRPLRPGHEPGTWRAPQALSNAGLVDAVGPAAIVDLARPAYRADPEPGTLLRNGHTLRRFNLELATTRLFLSGRSYRHILIQLPGQYTPPRGFLYGGMRVAV